jgi:hypothetical protein
MALLKHIKYKDKYGHLIEATFNVKKSTVKAVSQGIYEREYTDLEWQERVQHDELYETKFTTSNSGISVENTLDKIPEWLLRKKKLAFLSFLPLLTVNDYFTCIYK